MISIKASIQDGASETLADLLSSLTGERAKELSEMGGIAARNAAIAYHREFDQHNGWRGKSYLGPSKGDGTSFGSAVAGGWRLESHDADGAVISNAAAHYAFKVTGGTITAERVSHLTIPMTAEAKYHGRVAQYVQNTGRKLFPIKGKKALFERIAEVTGGQSSGSGGTKGGGARAVYALVKSVTMGPWPHALPPEDVIADAYAKTYRENLIDG